MAVGAYAESLIRGGYEFEPTLSKKFRLAGTTISQFRRFTTPETEQGDLSRLQSGDTVNFTRWKQLAVRANRSRITELQIVPESSVEMSRGTMQAFLHAEAVPLTEQLQAIAEKDVRQGITQILLSHNTRSMDAAASDQFLTTPLKLTPTGSIAIKSTTFATNGTVTATATRPFDTYDLEQAMLYLKSTALAPPWQDNWYICIGSPGLSLAIRNTAEWREDVHFGSPDQAINGLMGRWRNVIFVEETNIFPNTLGSTAFNGGGIIFGADPVMEKIIWADHIRTDLPTNFGLQQKLGWFGFVGFQLTWDTANPGEARAIHITSL